MSTEGRKGKRTYVAAIWIGGDEAWRGYWRGEGVGVIGLNDMKYS